MFVDLRYTVRIMKARTTDLSSATVSESALTVSELRFGKRRYLFHQPIVFKAEYADGVWIHENETLCLTSYAQRQEDALQELSEDFDNLWKEIVEEDDEKLSEDARLLKKNLLKIVTIKGGTIKDDISQDSGHRGKSAEKRV